MTSPVLVLVTGPPGSGKTTLAHALARTLGYPALSRDELKQGMVLDRPAEAAGDDDTITWAAFQLFFATVDLWSRAGVSLVAEAAFREERWRRGLAEVTAPYALRVVWCNVPAAIARERMAARMQDPRRRAHADQDTLDRDLAGTLEPMAPVDLGGPVITVDTSGGYRPTLAAIADFVRTPLPSGEWNT